MKFHFNLQRFGALNGSKVVSGTYGELWMDGEYLDEVKAFEARIEFLKEDIPLVGKFMQSTKIMGAKGTGTMRLHKVDSRMLRKFADVIRTGLVPEVEILSSVNDPTSFGAERVLLKGIVFDDLTVANWEAGAVGEVECPFTFDDMKPIDLINR